MRASGVLMPISSLPSKYGIGCFSKEAFDFVDLLKEAGQSYWQILPLGPTGYGDSPYQSFSTFAGNPYFIDLETLIFEGLLERTECDEADFGSSIGSVDYGKIYRYRKGLLKRAFERSDLFQNEAYQQFREENSDWLYDYALFMAIKGHFGDGPWSLWEEDIRMKTDEAVKKYTGLLKEEMEYYEFVQFKFYEQWEKLKSYANENGIKLIGDIPIYVALDSSDSWSHPELFQMDENKVLTGQSGCPPDGFSATGQLWGNPLYNWKYHQDTDYKWWKKRIKHHQKLFDVIRIDHFRGLDAYYSIPYGADTAEHGTWVTGPGYDFFKQIKAELGEIDIIAEDLGFLTESVFQLLKDSGYPGMKVLQFAFDSREAGNYLPHNYIRNSVAYTGTHDNDTTRGWFSKLEDEDREYALEYLGLEELDEENAAWTFIRMALGSVSDLAVIPIQDYLNIGEEGRINTPATLGDNWTWRLSHIEDVKYIVPEIMRITKLYGRLAPESKKTTLQ